MGLVGATRTESREGSCAYRRLRTPEAGVRGDELGPEADEYGPSAKNIIGKGEDILPQFLSSST